MTCSFNSPAAICGSNMLRILLAKDLRRAWRNPLPWLINIIVPLAMTALIGLAFGGKSDSGALGRIRFAIVDEDQSPLSDFLRGAANQSEGGKYLEPVFLDREEALRQINKNQIAVVLVIHTNFMRNYFTGREHVSLELIKNPAQSIHPAVMEELLGVVVTAMNAIARNFQSEFPDWLAVLEGKENYKKISSLIDRAGRKLEMAKEYLNPPLVSYEKDVRKDESKDGDSKDAPAFNLFAFLLPGMAGMFLLFLASNAMTDLNRELRFRTLERYHTLQHQLLPFVAAKVAFAVVLLLICSAILFGGGGLIFRIQWQHPLALVVLTIVYTSFAAGLMALLVAIVPDERRAGALNTIVGMLLGIAGGCAFPPQQLPAFLREHITPLLPSFWFVDTLRNVEFGWNTAWILVAVKLAGLSVLLIALAAFLFRRQFKKGLRA
jgi:ABC-type multidrug transport system permease subunit